jgi:starvation-inducible DNA-binding protein
MAKVKMDIGISETDRKKIAEGLGVVLADSYLLFLKTHNYHWNVKGPMFQTLHTLFETQYTELFTAIDLIAERIRSLGHRAPGSFLEFSQISTIEEEKGDVSATKMIQNLVKANEAVAKSARAVFPAAEKASDEATCDLLTQRLQVHEKTGWMLRTLLE